MKFNVWDFVFLVVILLVVLSFASCQKTHAQGVGRSATLDWSAVTTDINGDPIQGTVTYNIYQGSKGSPLSSKVKIISGEDKLQAVVAGLPYGETCWQVTAQTVNNREGDASNEACKSFDYARAGKPALTVK